MSWFSLVIGQNVSRQLVTSSENLVASAQFLVALATSETQFQALVLVFERSREIEKKKKRLNDLVLNQCHDKTNLNLARSVPYSLALTKKQ